MLSLEQRLELVIAEGWKLLPSMKKDAAIAAIFLDDLDQIHGQFSPDTRELKLNWRLFAGDANMIPLMDVHGEDPPRHYPLTSRALHTFLHECFHAIGSATGVDESQEWCALSGWVHADDNPIGTGRFVETRVGWPWGPSEWRYTTGGTWFVREYSTKSPQEDLADACAHIALGWWDFFGASGQAKLTYLRRHVWQETGTHALTATAERWRQRLRPFLAAAPSRVRPAVQQRQIDRLQSYEATLREAVEAWNETIAEDISDEVALTGQLPPVTTPQHRESLWDSVGETVLALWLATWRRTGQATLPTHDQLAPVLAHTDQAVSSYTETTQRWLETAVTPLRETGAPREALQEAVREVMALSSERRAPMLAQAEAHRAVQAAQYAGWQAHEAIQEVIWRTAGDGQVCPYCAALEGEVVSLGTPFFRVGDIMEGLKGQAQTVTYADIYYPGAHPGCRCWLEAVEE